MLMLEAAANNTPFIIGCGQGEGDHTRIIEIWSTISLMVVEAQGTFTLEFQHVPSIGQSDC